MSTRVPQRAAGSSPAARLGLRCDHCEVLWRGAAEDPCWSCGRPGRIAAAVLIIPG